MATTSLTNQVVGNQKPLGMQVGNQTTWNGGSAPPQGALANPIKPSAPGSLAPTSAARMAGSAGYAPKPTNQQNWAAFGPPKPGDPTYDAWKRQQAGLPPKPLNDVIIKHGTGKNPVSHSDPTAALTTIFGSGNVPGITDNPLWQNYDVRDAINQLLMDPDTGLMKHVADTKSLINSYSGPTNTNPAGGPLYQLYQKHLQSLRRDTRHSGFGEQGMVNDRGFDNSGGLQFRLNQLGEQEAAEETRLGNEEGAGKIKNLNKDIDQSKGSVMWQIQKILRDAKNNASKEQGSISEIQTAGNPAVDGATPSPLNPSGRPLGGNTGKTPAPGPTNTAPQSPGTQRYAPKGWTAGQSGWFQQNGKWNFINEKGNIQLGVSPPPKNLGGHKVWN